MCCDIQTFPKTFELYVFQHKFNDIEEIYTNGSDLIQVFRVLQGWSHFKHILEDEYSQEIVARNRVIIDLYTLILKNFGDFNDTTITSDVLMKLNSLYKDIESFNLLEDIDKKLLKS